MRKRIGRTILTTVVLLYLLLCGVWFLADMAKAEPLDTHHSKWRLVRETADEDGANFTAVYDLAGDEGNFANKNSNSVANGGPFRIGSRPGELGTPNKSLGAVWKFVICGGVENNDTFSFHIVGWAEDNGMLRVLAVGDGIIGTQDVVLYPDDDAVATAIWWADTISIDSVTPVRWPGVSVRNSGNDEVASILVDTTGLEWIQFVIYDADGTSTDANDITVFGRPY